MYLKKNAIVTNFDLSGMLHLETSSYLYSTRFGYKEDRTYVYTIGEGQYTISTSEIGKIDIWLLNETPSDEEIEMLKEINSNG